MVVSSDGSVGVDWEFDHEVHWRDEVGEECQEEAERQEVDLSEGRGGEEGTIFFCCEISTFYLALLSLILK